MALQNYFDAAASTPLDPQAKEVLIEHLDLEGNNNSKHKAGFLAQKLIDQSLQTMAKILGCKAEQLSVCYSGTDANRKALFAFNDEVWKKDPSHTWGSFTYGSWAEHSSVADEIMPGKTFDPLTFQGLSDQAQVIALTGANSETGNQYDLAKLRENYPQAKILMDASQSFAHYQNPPLQAVDAAVFTPQKFYGPKHIGILYLKHPENYPQISKDSHTKFPALVAASAKAFELWAEEATTHRAQLEKWEQYITKYISKYISKYIFHTHGDQKVPGILNVAFQGVRGGELMAVLSRDEGLCVSIGSACTSDIMIPTDFIKSIQPDPTYQYPIRISLHKFLTDQSVEDFCEILAHYVGELRKN